MRRHRPLDRLLALALPLPLLAAMAWPAAAALPAAVDGRELPTLAPILERVVPAVVNVHSRSVRANPLANDPFFGRLFGLPPERVERSLGSGVVIDAERGLIVTNNHVVEGADELFVTLSDGRTLDGRLVGTDPDTDVALLRVDQPRDLAELPLAEAELRVGDFVVAVGNPFGLGQTVTSGIVSALGRRGLRGLNYQNFIQTDASINPGNSGGALINLRGELVGINTAIFSPSGGNVGIGFAIPADIAAYVVSELLAHGLVRRGRLGVALQDLDPRLVQALDLEQASGALVTRVLPKAAAARGGLEAGDVIVAVNGQRITSAADLRNAEGLLRVGEKAEIGYLRDGRRRTARVAIEAAEPDRVHGATVHPELAGTLLANLDPEIVEQLGLDGVVVAEVRRGGPAAAYGLRRGDLIIEADRRKVGSVAELQALADPDEALLLNVVRRGRSYLLLLE